MARSSVASAERVTEGKPVASAYPQEHREGGSQVTVGNRRDVALPALTDARLRSFMAKVRTAANGCWEWQAATNTNGYGVFAGVAAHRVAFHWFVAPFTEPQIDHLCRNRVCVNPHHLEPVTASENVLRAVNSRGCCKRGHLRTPENTYLWQTNGGVVRVCRPCKRDANRRWEKASAERE